MQVDARPNGMRVPATRHSTDEKRVWLAHVKRLGKAAYLRKARAEAERETREAKGA